MDPDQQVTLYQKNRASTILYKTGSWSAGDFRKLNDHLFGKELFIRFTASAFCKLLSVYVFNYFPFGFESRMWDLIVSVPHHWLSFYTRRIGPVCCYLTLIPDQHATLDQTNRVSMLLYNTGSWSKGDFIPDKRASMLSCSTGSWAAVDFVQEDPCLHAVI